MTLTISSHSPALQPYRDTRRGPIPGKPVDPRAASNGHSKMTVEDQVKALLKKASAGVIKPNAKQPDTLFTAGRSGKPASMLFIVCRSQNAKALSFLKKVLLPAVDQLAQRTDVARSIDAPAPVDWKRTAGNHLMAGADAALLANNPKALSAMLPVAQKHFPDDVLVFIQSRLVKNPQTAATFAAAGVPPEALEAMLAEPSPSEVPAASAAAGAAGAAGAAARDPGATPPSAAAPSPNSRPSLGKPALAPHPAKA